MMANCIPLNKLRIIHDYFLKGNINKRQLAKTIKISRTTIRKYLSELKLFNNQFPNEINSVNSFVVFIHKTKTITNRYLSLKPFFQSVFDSIACSNSDRKIEWGKYITKFPDGYSYTQFAFYFSKWLNDNNLAIGQKNWKIRTVPDNDLVTCKKWRLSTDRRKWEKAVAILDSLKGKPISYISSKIERSPRKVKSWLKSYEKHGLEGLQNKRRKFNKEFWKNIETKKENLIKLIHESPKNFGINRTSWSLKSLSSAYCQKFRITISISMISEYIKSQGYAFRKAKKVLTSPDPKYQEKLDEVNSDDYRNINLTPHVELAPLPASAQFLNVIESVFSGMAKGIIHNSDYKSIEECKTSIDLYFKERNEYFQKYPKRAGKKIWGKETQIPIFDETKNFKDSKWR